MEPSVLFVESQVPLESKVHWKLRFHCLNLRFFHWNPRFCLGSSSRGWLSRAKQRGERGRVNVRARLMIWIFSLLYSFFLFFFLDWELVLETLRGQTERTATTTLRASRRRVLKVTVTTSDRTAQGQIFSFSKWGYCETL